MLPTIEQVRFLLLSENARILSANRSTEIWVEYIDPVIQHDLLLALNVSPV